MENLGDALHSIKQNTPMFPAWGSKRFQLDWFSEIKPGLTLRDAAAARWDDAKHKVGELL